MIPGNYPASPFRVMQSGILVSLSSISKLQSPYAHDLFARMHCRRRLVEM